MPDSEHDSDGRAMLWFNLVGISLATILLGSFFWLYGNGFVSLVMHLFTPPGMFPDH